MSVTGLCQVCEDASATHTCPTCGRVVCLTHWDDAAGVCTECVGGRQWPVAFGCTHRVLSHCVALRWTAPRRTASCRVGLHRAV